MKPLLLMSLLSRHPQEFFERASTIVVSRWESLHGKRAAYEVVSTEKAIRLVQDKIDVPLMDSFAEPGLAELAEQIGKHQLNGPEHGPFGTFHNGGSLLAQFCYAITRCMRPSIVLETGVCYGVTSSYFLRALELNGTGQLHSIDLPPLGKNADAYVGSFVPGQLRRRWMLHRGTTRRLLRPLLASMGHVDVFLHDSLHTYRNMRMEFAAVWPKLSCGGVLISDDVEGNAAFDELVRQRDVALSLVLKETGKKSLFGVAIKAR